MEIIFLLIGVFVGAVGAHLLARRARARRERLAEILRDREQEAMMNMIASGLAHEVRNPLSTLRMNLQLLQEDWANPITERERKGHRKIETLLRETGRLETMISNFLRWAARPELHTEPTDLNAVTAEVLDSVAAEAEQTSIEVRREFASPLSPVDADPSLIRHAVTNLVVNAHQAMPKGGTLTLRTVENGQFIRLSVTDTGPGIPEADRKRIFTLYYSSKPGGTGLGLPMVEKIIKEHRGTLQLDSKLDHGSTFTICLKKSAS